MSHASILREEVLCDTARIVAAKGCTDINLQARDELGNTPLHAACASGFTHSAELLLKHGADIDARSPGGLTPLHVAAINGYPAVTRLLLRRRPAVNAPDDKGMRALHYAVLGVEWGCVRALAEAGAEVGVYNEAGRSPVDMARATGEAALHDYLRSRLRHDEVEASLAQARTRLLAPGL